MALAFLMAKSFRGGGLSAVFVQATVPRHRPDEKNRKDCQPIILVTSVSLALSSPKHCRQVACPALPNCLLRKGSFAERDVLFTNSDS
ncbi:hypothetical protein F4780DRAFT_706295 [Xylariomycetidae sp. FL0641]|nr:hypothetical protein F4780DRAFT_706295 [Xylariomycetidae sp. FL0641]